MYISKAYVIKHSVFLKTFSKTEKIHRIYESDIYSSRFY